MTYFNIIIDGSNLAYRSFYGDTVNCIKNPDSIYTGGIELFIKKIKSLKKDYGYDDSKVFILFDNPTSTRKIRQLIDENYKSHRLDNKFNKEIFQTISYLIEILRNYFSDTYIIRIDNCESDDIVPLVISENPVDTLVVSADLDWARNITEKCHWYNFKKLYDLEVFKQEYKFYPNGNRIKLYKAFRGDHSDEIKSAVPYIPENVLIHILEKHYDVPIEKLTAVILRDAEVPEKWRLAIRTADRDIRKNYKLVDFINVNVILDEYTQPCKRNKSLARLWLKILDIDTSNHTWLLDLEKPDDFLSIERFRKGVR